VPRHHRQISRVVFYLGVALMLWAMGRLTEPGVSMEPTDGELGVSPAYIASPEVPWFATLPEGR
jgi:hypothetical protein